MDLQWYLRDRYYFAYLDKDTFFLQENMLKHDY